MDNLENHFETELNPLESFALMEILSELSDQLGLHHSIIDSNIINFSDQSIASKDEQASKNVEQKGTNSLIKLKNDLEFLTQTVENVREELENKNSFSTLRIAVEEEERRQDRSVMLESDIGRMQAIKEQLEKRLQEEEENCRIRNRDQLCLLNELKDQIHLAKQKGEEDSQFAKVWLKARNDFTSGLQKSEVLDRKLQIEGLSEYEERDCEAYENVVAWTKLKCSQLDKQIAQWKEKFALDDSKMKGKIARKEESIAEQEKKITALEELIHRQIEELIPWEEEKNQERLERIQHMRRYYSCRKIQRWWRKYMIQHGLYKKKKVKPKPTKPKGTKGKIKSPRRASKPSNP